MMVVLNGNVIAEEVDGEILVCDLERSLVHRLDKESADLLRALRSSSPEGFSMDESDALDRLIDLGVVIERKSFENIESLTQRTMSRRKVMGMTAAAATAGIVTLALPEAAAAESVEGFGDIGVTPGLSVPPTFEINNEAVISLTTTGRMRILWSHAGLSVFTYGWTSRDSSYTGPVRASGVLTSTPGYTFSVALDNVNIGQTIYVSVASNTNPVFIYKQTLTRTS